MRKILLAISLLLVWVAPSFGAVAYVTSNSEDAAGGQETSLTVQVTASGADRFAVGCVAINLRVDAGRTVSTFTYDGAAGTLLVGHEVDDARIEVWYWKNPNTTTNANVVATLDGTAHMAIGVTVFSGVEQSDPIGTGATGGVTLGTSMSATATGAVADGLVADCASRQNGTADEMATTEAGQTERYEDETTSGTDSRNIKVAASTRSATGSVAMGWDWTAAGNSDGAMAAFAIKPVVASGRAKGRPIIVD